MADIDNREIMITIQMKKKALLFLPYLAPYRIDVLNRIGEYYDLKVVFLYENAPEQSFNQDLLRLKLRVSFVVLNKGFEIKGRIIRVGIFNLINSYKPDVIFTNEYGVTSLIISLYSRLKLIKSLIVSTTSDNVDMAKGVKWFRKIARSFVLSSTNSIIVYNRNVQFWYKKNFPKLDVRICPNIQDPTVLNLNKSEINKISKIYTEKLDLANKEVFIYVGRLHKVKGLDLLIETFSNIENENVRLILVGDGPEKEDLQLLIESLGLKEKITIAGRFDGINLYAWYNIADLFILPSIFEPFGAVVNESLIFGVPVLCSKNAGASYFIDSGKNGELFDPENLFSFREVIEKRNKLYSCNKFNLMVYDFDDSVKQYVYNEGVN